MFVFIIPLCINKRLDSNIESKSLNNTYLNIIKIFNKLSPASEASREVANFTERKNTHPPVLMPLLPPFFIGRAIKTKAGAIKCCKEIKLTAPPNEWRNIPFRVDT